MSEDIILALKAIEDCSVRGHLKMIDDTRLVFIGEDPTIPEIIYLAFRNAEGDDTKLSLSREAYEALKYLMNEPFKGKRIPFPYKLTWQMQIIPEVLEE